MNHDTAAETKVWRINTSKSGITFKVGARQQVVPPGEYIARIIDIKEEKNYKRRVFHFYFEIAEGPHRGVCLRGFVNGQYETFSEYSKLYQWYQAVSGDALEVGAEVTLDAFYEKILKVEVAPAKLSGKTSNPFSNVSRILGVYMEL